MRALVLGDREKEKIQALVNKAYTEPYSLDMMHKRISGHLPPPGDVGYVISLPVGYTVVFSVEQHPEFWFKCISISVDKKGKFPSIYATNMIIAEFGFEGSVENLPEGIVRKDKEVEAIFIMQKDSNNGIHPDKFKKLI